MRELVPFIGHLQERPYGQSVPFIDEAAHKLEADGALMLRPWCRVCNDLVWRCQWTKDGADWLLRASCHGETTICSVSHLWPIYERRVELFCQSHPRMEDAPIWWVGQQGEELQPSKAYIDHAIKRSGAYSGPFAEWLRKSGNVLISCAFLFTLCSTLGLIYLLYKYLVFAPGGITASDQERT